MNEKEQTRSDKSRPAVEWIFGSVSAIVIAGLVLFLGYQALFGDTRPPELLVSVDRIDRLDSGTAVIVSVANRGDEAAAAVTVYASASDASGRALRKQIEFDYIAAHAMRRGAFLFPGPISSDAFELEIGGYTDP